MQMHLVQVWDHLPGGDIDFNLIYTFDREGRSAQHEVFTEHYHPLPRALLLDTLSELGYERPQLLPFPAQSKNAPPTEAMDWYCIWAQKPE